MPKWRPFGVVTQHEAKALTGATRSGAGCGKGTKVTAVFVSLHHHLGFQAPEIAASASLLFAECRTLKAGGLLSILVQLPVWVSFYSQNHTLVSSESLRENQEVNFGDKIPETPGIAPELVRNFAMIMCSLDCCPWC